MLKIATLSLLSITSMALSMHTPPLPNNLPANSSETSTVMQKSEMEIRLAKIIQNMADIDENGNTHLHLGATCPDYPGLISILLANNPELKKSINHYNNKGFTPLLLAMHKKNDAGAIALLEAGANPNLPENKASK